MNPIGVLLIAVGIFLEALSIPPTWLQAGWLGTALIIFGVVIVVFGAVIVVFDYIRDHSGKV